LFRFPESEAKAARFGAHGRVAVAFTDGTLRVWNTSRPGEAPATYGGAVGLMDDWNPASRVQTAQSLARVLGPVLLTPRQVDAIAQQPSVHYSAPAFNADGNLLAVSVGSRIQVLDAGIEGLASEACAILPRNLSWQDWLRLAPVGEPYDLTCPQRPVERSVVAEGDRQAKDGHDAQAIAIYRRVAALGGAISPEGRLDAWRQYGLVTANIQPDRKKLSVALKAYRRFKADDGEKQTGPIPYAGQLRLCRWSTLLGEFREALEVCDEAVNLLSDGMAHDSRGLARALSGDLAGARADFEKSADYIDTADWRTTRQAWVEALKKGQNPITPEVVKKIVAEDLAQ
jgi:tetratricopeptide (TPR) repeat protein